MFFLKLLSSVSFFSGQQQMLSPLLTSSTVPIFFSPEIKVLKFNQSQEVRRSSYSKSSYLGNLEPFQVLYFCKMPLSTRKLEGIPFFGCRQQRPTWVNLSKRKFIEYQEFTRLGRSLEKHTWHWPRTRAALKGSGSCKSLQDALQQSQFLEGSIQPGLASVVVLHTAEEVGVGRM